MTNADLSTRVRHAAAGLPEALDLACTPTPIDLLERTSEALGSELLVKRDDLTGSVCTGNKIRKLEFALAEAEREGATHVVTCGGVQSNHCRATAVAAARLGMGCTVLLRGAAPEVRQGNLLLDWLVGADIRFITAAEYAKRDRHLQAVREEVAATGGRCYVIPEGATNAIGSLGYVAAALEIAQQASDLGVVPDVIYCAAGSGGTVAGLATGLAAAGLPTRVRGVCVCNDAAYFDQVAGRVAGEMARRYLPGLNVDSVRWEFVDGFKGRGYALSTPEELQTLREVARTEGIVLDPVYTLKAWRGMVEHCTSGVVPRGSRVMFLHTGGVFALFATPELQA